MWGTFTDLYLDHPNISKRHKPNRPSPSFSSQESTTEDLVEDVVATAESEDEATDLQEWYCQQKKASASVYQYSS